LWVTVPGDSTSLASLDCKHTVSWGFLTVHTCQHLCTKLYYPPSHTSKCEEGDEPRREDTHHPSDERKRGATMHHVAGTLTLSLYVSKRWVTARVATVLWTGVDP